MELLLGLFMILALVLLLPIILLLLPLLVFVFIVMVCSTIGTILMIALIFGGLIIIPALVLSLLAM